MNEQNGWVQHQNESHKLLNYGSFLSKTVFNLDATLVLWGAAVFKNVDDVFMSLFPPLSAWNLRTNCMQQEFPEEAEQ